MRFDGGTCENIYGESLDYEIIRHEQNLTTECRLKRRVVHMQRWLIWTIIFTYLASIIGIHKTDNFYLIIFSIFLFAGVLLKAYLKVKRECVIVGSRMGLQLTTTYVIGRQTTQFISANRIRNVLINEGFLSQRLIFYLTLLIGEKNSDQKLLIPLFTHLVPRLPVLKRFYQNLYSVIHVPIHCT